MQKKKTIEEGMSKHGSSYGISDTASNIGNGMRPSFRQSQKIGVPQSGFIKLQQAGDPFDKAQNDKLFEELRADIKALQETVVELRNEASENKTEAKQGDIAINSRISEQMRA